MLRSRFGCDPFVPKLEWLEQRDLLSFLPPVSYPVGTSPTQLVVADFTGDNKRDVAVVTAQGKKLVLLHGDGTGSFQPGVSLDTGKSPYGVVAADVNADGAMDLACTNSGDDNISVFLGNGNGTFQAKKNFAANNGTWAIAAGHLDGDGKIDLAASNFFGGGTISVFYGNGDGTFKPQVSKSAGGEPVGVQIADLDGDGIGDLTADSNSSENVTVHLSTGGVAQYVLGDNPWGHTLADVNRDGHLDIVAANNYSDTVSVLLNQGNGQFLPGVQFATGSFPVFPVVADVDRDRKPDIAVVNNHDQSVGVLLGNGDGTFKPHVGYLATAHIGLAMANLTPDRYPDMVVSSKLLGSVTVRLNDASWPAPIPPIVPPPNPLPARASSPALQAKIDHVHNAMSMDAPIGKEVKPSQARPILRTIDASLGLFDEPGVEMRAWAVL